MLRVRWSFKLVNSRFRCEGLRADDGRLDFIFVLATNQTILLFPMPSYSGRHMISWARLLAIPKFAFSDAVASTRLAVGV